MGGRKRKEKCEDNTSDENEKKTEKKNGQSASVGVPSVENIYFRSTVLTPLSYDASLVAQKRRIVDRMWRSATSH